MIQTLPDGKSQRHADARVVVHRDPTLMLFDNAKNCCQRQTRSFARFFSSEKGLKNSLTAWACGPSWASRNALPLLWTPVAIIYFEVQQLPRIPFRLVKREA
jgi:hypothetical protein